MKLSMPTLLPFEDDGKQEAIHRITCGLQDDRTSGIPPSPSFPTDGNGNPSGLVIPDGSHRESILAFFRWPQADDGRE